MKIGFALFLVIHGLIHLIGFAKAYRLADPPQLTQPIARPVGVLWLLAALLLLTTAGALFFAPRWYWAVGAAALVSSQAAISLAFRDARYGTLANLALLLGVAYGLWAQGPLSLGAQYQRDVQAALARGGSTATITEADLARLPPPVQRYLRVTGWVGKPQVYNLRARFRGQIRSDPQAPWMTFTAEQYSFYQPPARLFYMAASRAGVPFQALHRYVGDTATMRVRLAALIPITDASGPELDQAETVTLFNDLCLLAPPMLLSPAIDWQLSDERTVQALFQNAGHRIQAVLQFSESGELIDFSSEDRYRASADGRTFTRTRWTTPISDYRRFGAHRAMAYGEAHWHTPGGESEGEFAYGRFELDELTYNLDPAGK